MNKLIVIGYVCLVCLLMGCNEKPLTIPVPKDLPMVVPTPIEESWQDEFECDKWEYTGNTLYKDSDECQIWQLMNNQTRIKSDSLAYIEWYKLDDNLAKNCYFEKNKTACRAREDIRFIRFEDVCSKEPYQEQRCIHQKLIGRVLK